MFSFLSGRDYFARMLFLDDFFHPEEKKEEMFRTDFFSPGPLPDLGMAFSGVFVVDAIS